MSLLKRIHYGVRDSAGGMWMSFAESPFPLNLRWLRERGNDGLVQCDPFSLILVLLVLARGHRRFHELTRVQIPLRQHPHKHAAGMPRGAATKHEGKE